MPDDGISSNPHAILMLKGLAMLPFEMQDMLIRSVLVDLGQHCVVAQA
jgi:hypothetical protein